MKLSDEEIRNFLGLDVTMGGDRRVISKIANLIPGKNGALSFCRYETEDAFEMIMKSQSSIIIYSDKLKVVKLTDRTLIQVPRPQLAFIKVVNKFFPWRKFTSGIHPAAVVSSSAQVHPSAYIGPYCVISDDVEIGENSVLFGQIFIYPNVKIGKRVIINAGTIIGAEGFGYERDEDGMPIQAPQIAGMVIEDDVEIGCNSTIPRGALGDTIIRQGTKIDDLVHIAHNMIVGRNCMITSHFCSGGGVEIGDGSFTGLGAVIKNQVKIGKNAFIGMGAVVLKDVPDSSTVIGNPARLYSKKNS